MRQPPGFEKTSRLVARTLGISASQLQSGFRPAVESDIDDVTAFRLENSANFARSNDRAYLLWRYRFGRPQGGMGDLYLLRLQGRLLGIIGTEDMDIRLRSTNHLAVRTMDILVAREAQASGLGVWLNQATMQEKSVAIAVGANRNSAGTVRRLFHSMPAMTEWRLQIDVRGFVRRRVLLPLLGIPIGALLSGALRLVRRTGEFTADRTISLRPIERIDDEAVRFYATGGASDVVVVRTPAFLNYRLFDNPRGRYTVTGAWRGDSLAGLVAWRILRTGESGCAAHVIDIRADGANPGPVLKKLLLHVGRQAESAGCSHVSLMMHAPQSEPALWMSGFLAARHNQKIFGLYASDPAVLAELSTATWSLTDLCDDNDGS